MRPPSSSWNRQTHCVKPPRHWIWSSALKFLIGTPQCQEEAYFLHETGKGTTEASHSQGCLVLTYLPSREQFLPGPGCKRSAFECSRLGGQFLQRLRKGIVWSLSLSGWKAEATAQGRKYHNPLSPSNSYRYKNAEAWVAPPATGTQSRGKVFQSSRRSPWRGSHRSWKSCSAAWLLWAGRVSSASVPRGNAWWAGTRAWRPECCERRLVSDPGGWQAGWGLSPALPQPEGRRGAGEARGPERARARLLRLHPPAEQHLWLQPFWDTTAVNQRALPAGPGAEREPRGVGRHPAPARPCGPGAKLRTQGPAAPAHLLPPVRVERSPR